MMDVIFSKKEKKCWMIVYMVVKSGVLSWIILARNYMSYVDFEFSILT